MSARDNILGRIRVAQGRTGAPDAAREELVASYLASHPQSPRPAPDDDIVERFRERAEALSTSIDSAPENAAIPRCVADYLTRNNLPLKAVTWPEWGALEWAAAGIAVSVRPANGDDLVGITGAFCAIAETGTLMMVSGSDTPPSASLLPETHIAIVRRDQIVQGMEEGWALLRARYGTRPPRAVNFISGPSRTADIEQTVTLGAHGPYRVHLILL